MKPPRPATAGRLISAAAIAILAVPALGQDLRSVAATPNQLRTADALENWYAVTSDCTCDLAQTVQLLHALPDEDARRGLDALSGQDLAGMFDPAKSLSNTFVQRLTWQLRPAGPEPPRATIDYVDAPTGGAPPAAYDPCGNACGVRRTYLAPPRPTTWVQAFGGAADSNFGVGSYDANFGGVLFGGHVPVCDEAAFGLAAAYGKADADAALTSLDVESWRFLGYGRYAGEIAYVLGGLGAGFDDYGTRRRIVIDTVDLAASGDAGGSGVFTFVETGLTLPVSDEIALQPLAGLTAARLSRDAYSERDAGGLGLHVSGADDSLLATYLGGRAVLQHYVSPKLLLRPELRAAWWHDYLAAHYF